MFNIFSFVIIIIVTLIFLTQNTTKDRYFYLLIFELFIGFNKINLGYFMRIGGFLFDYDDVLLGVLFIMSLGMLKGKRFFKSTVVLLIITVLGVLLLYIYPADVEVMGFRSSISWDDYMKDLSTEMEKAKFTSQSILMLFRVVIYCVILTIVNTLFSKKEFLKMGKIFFKFEKIIVALGVVEFILKYIVHYDWSNILTGIFGKSTSQHSGLIRLQGLTKEPSYYALALCNLCFLGLFLFFIENPKSKKAKRQYFTPTLLALIIGLSSGSFSMVIVFLAIIVTFFKLRNINRKYYNGKLILLFVLVAWILLVLSNFASTSYVSEGWLGRLNDSVIVIKATLKGDYYLARSYGSESVRLFGSLISLKAFLARPLIGLGIGSVYCLSGLISILSSVGVAGFIAWYKMLFSDYRRTKMRAHSFTLMMMIPVLFCCDIYTMYDTSYLLLVPLAVMAYDRIKIGDKYDRT